MPSASVVRVSPATRVLLEHIEARPLQRLPFSSTLMIWIFPMMGSYTTWTSMRDATQDSPNQNSSRSSLGRKPLRCENFLQIIVRCHGQLTGNSHAIVVGGQGLRQRVVRHAVDTIHRPGDGITTPVGGGQANAGEIFGAAALEARKRCDPSIGKVGGRPAVRATEGRRGLGCEAVSGIIRPNTAQKTSSIVKMRFIVIPPFRFGFDPQAVPGQEAGGSPCGWGCRCRG